ncbi:CGNR zinc finger domain-containing protein [Actinoallomurus sp. CA-150999]|uniref:CGNR zinc finger domain-containing protein n=1 Tax=Actinoallomurus sp. CA-150999 TaxID=3239887 RepID=UPI003D8D736E
MSGSDSALLLRDFVNTYDVDCDIDDFGAPCDLSGWLIERGLTPPGTRASESDLALAIALREGLRAAMLGHHDPAAAAPPAGLALPTDPDRPPGLARPTHPDRPPGLARPTDPDRPPGLDRLLAALPLRVSLDGPALVPLRDGIRGGLSVLAAAVMRSAAEGDWPRLKVCRETTCRWAFLDTSKNRSRSWCSMRMCGNRTKTRAYRARRRATASDA